MGDAFLAVYDGFADRHRIRAGAVIKSRQNRVIFELGITHSLVPQRRVLDIGPGDGVIARLAQGAQLPYVAVEGSSSLTAMLRQRGLEVHEGYVPPLPASVAGRFSTCFLLHVLEHMPDHRAASQLFLQVHDALLPGGTFVVACPDFARWGADFYDCDYTHSFPLTQRRLRQIALDHDFEVVHQTVYCGPVFGVAGLPLAWGARMIYPRFLDGLIGAKVPRDVANRGMLTFLPNLLMVARRRQVAA